MWASGSGPNFIINSFNIIILDSPNSLLVRLRTVWKARDDPNLLCRDVYVCQLFSAHDAHLPIGVVKGLEKRGTVAWRDGAAVYHPPSSGQLSSPIARTLPRPATKGRRNAERGSVAFSVTQRRLQRADKELTKRRVTNSQPPYNTEDKMRTTTIAAAILLSCTLCFVGAGGSIPLNHTTGLEFKSLSRAFVGRECRLPSNKQSCEIAVRDGAVLGVQGLLSRPITEPVGVEGKEKRYGTERKIGEEEEEEVRRP
ncbi:hypothetical protein J437_LFUL012008 [Ladona fulva]|uniref:Uncharacterized protein n=1 Tax=Ladona fulva TaxID=123851 RepID=A0A8K0P3T0_LADFU|nr:hypothetical protein J437_LFUL012008 [Ladona fulva]